MIRSHENRNMRIYAYNYDDPKGHADKLRRGIAALGPNFLAAVCGLCEGEGQYRQNYNMGCGMGMSRMMGKCSYCDGLGLVLGGKPAPLSVMHQVLNASERQPFDAIVVDDSQDDDTRRSSGTVTGRWASRSGHIESIPRTAASSLRHTVVDGDTLSSIALHYYGDGGEESWRRIWNYNRDGLNRELRLRGLKIDDPDSIFPDTILLIPNVRMV